MTESKRSLVPKHRALDQRSTSALYELVTSGWYKIAGLTVLLTALFSVDFINPMSSSVPNLTLLFVALVDTVLLSYIVTSSGWSGWKMWFAVFLGFYGIRYVLTALESVYLSSVLSADAVLRLFINGALVSASFAAVLIKVFGAAKGVAPSNPRLAMPVREWSWKIASSGIVYLLLFVLFGVLVYYPIADHLDPSGLAIEQGSVEKASALWVLPFEALRGMVWALMTVPIIIASRLEKGKIALLVGLLFSLPMLDIFLSTKISPGLQVAHFFELLGENLLFGVSIVWILGLKSRLN